MYAAVCDISYIAESVASWEKESGSVSETVGLQYPVWLLHNFDSMLEIRATTKIMSVCMSLLTAMRLSIIRSFTLHQTRYRHSIQRVRIND